MKKKDLIKELEQRGTVEIVNDEVVQVTRAIDETEGKAKFLMFGELKEESVIPIDKACAKCDHCYFPTIAQCQERQGKDAKARGFTDIICPSQFC